jgi:ABC-2 type transport system permease protein
VNATTAVARQTVRLLAREGDLVIVHLGLPVALVALATPLFEQGTRRGANAAVTAVAVLFAFVTAGYLAGEFFREYAWNTFERLVASPASPAEILAGRGLPALGWLVAQQGLLFGVGVVVFGATVEGSPAALALVLTALAACATCFGVFLVAVAPSARHVNLFTNLGAVALAGAGGAVVPLSDMPGWLAAIAPALPSYWAARGIDAVVEDGGGTSAVLLPTAMLLGFGAVFLLVAARTFRVEHRKAAR